MKNDQVQYKVNIFDEQYTLISDESRQHIVDSAQKVDELIKKIITKSSSVDVRRAAVFASLQVMSELIKLQAEVEKKVFKQDQLLSRIEQALIMLNS